MKIAILTDSSCGWSESECREKNINLLPLILIDEKHKMYFDDGKNITYESLISKMDSGIKFKTSLVPNSELIKTFSNLLKTNDHVLYLPISKGISGQYETALASLKNSEIAEKVTVVDTQCISVALQNLILIAQKMITNKVNPAQISEKLSQIGGETLMFFTPENLVHLKRSGRVSGLAAFIGNLLRIVPVIIWEKGRMKPISKTHSAIRGIDLAITNYFQNKKISIDNYVPSIVHAEVPEENIIKLTEKNQFKTTSKKMIVQKLPVTIIAHTGPGTIGVILSYQGRNKNE